MFCTLSPASTEMNVAKLNLAGYDYPLETLLVLRGFRLKAPLPELMLLSVMLGAEADYPSV